MLGSRLGRLTLAAVVDYDVAVGSGWLRRTNGRPDS